MLDANKFEKITVQAELYPYEKYDDQLFAIYRPKQSDVKFKIDSTEYTIREDDHSFETFCICPPCTQEVANALATLWMRTFYNEDDGFVTVYEVHNWYNGRNTNFNKLKSFIYNQFGSLKQFAPEITLCTYNGIADEEETNSIKTILGE